MSCDLSELEIQILYILYRNTCFNSAGTYHSKKIKKNLKSKYSHQEVDKATSHLQTKAYITAVKKQDPKFYILDSGKAYSVLKDHGKNVTPPGRTGAFHLD